MPGADTRRFGGGLARCATSRAGAAQIRGRIQAAAFYLRHGNAVDFVFMLVHQRDAVRDRQIGEADYPLTAGYDPLVRDCREGDARALAAWPLGETRAYIEKVIACSIDAEFNAYLALPEIDHAALLRWFRREGAALAHTLTQLKRRAWVLTNPNNPSTKRLLAIDVKEVRRHEAVAGTTEYWYLRWWSTTEQKYRYAYRETNRQTCAGCGVIGLFTRTNKRAARMLLGGGQGRIGATRHSRSKSLISRRIRSGVSHKRCTPAQHIRQPALTSDKGGTGRSTLEPGFEAERKRGARGLKLRACGPARRTLPARRGSCRARPGCRSRSQSASALRAHHRA
jgi:hypothetical protein